MKKNKKYWKQQAKQWRNIAEMETESANEWSYKAHSYSGQITDLENLLYSVEAERNNYKNELSTLRQYNIGKKSVNVTGTSTSDYAKWAIKEYRIPVGMDKKGKRAVKEASKPLEKSIIRWWKRND